VFVDDVPANVESAARLGFQAVLHRTAADTIEIIERLVGCGEQASGDS